MIEPEERIRIRALNDFNTMCINFFGVNKTHKIDPVTFSPRVESCSILPFLSIPYETLGWRQTIQELMDDFWSLGIRPTDGQYTSGQVNAMHDHLEDMRSFAFFALGMKK